MGKRARGNRRTAVYAARCQHCGHSATVLKVLEHECKDCGGSVRQMVCAACVAEHDRKCPMGLWPIDWKDHHPTVSGPYRN